MRILSATNVENPVQQTDNLSLALFKRKGGGGGHSSGHSSSGKGGKGGKGSSSAAAKHGASSAFTDSRSGGSFSLSSSGLGKSTASAYSDGGGKRITLGSNTAFCGREAGGGTRDNVYGSSRFGSGYPYGGYGVYVDYRSVPYYFYPVPPSYGYYGGDQYLNVNESLRPGGALIEAIVQPSWNTSSVTYRIIGDNVSVTAVFDALVANCSIANSTSAFFPFNPSPLAWPLPEQVIQYYRASSLALTLDVYNNTAALISNMPASNTSGPNTLTDTPLPANLNMTLLQCINATVGASVPLVDVPSHKLSTSAIVGIAIGSVGAAASFLLMCLYCCGCVGLCMDRCKERKAKKRARKQAYKSLGEPLVLVREDIKTKTDTYTQDDRKTSSVA